MTISGSVKQTAGMARLSQARFPAGDDLRDHLALGHGAMGEHWLAGDVADRVDATHGCAAALIDTDEAAGAIEIEFFETPSLGARLAPDGDEHLACGNSLISPAAVSITNASPE